MSKTKGVGLNLTEGSIWKALLLFAGPIVLTNLIQQLYSTVDLVIIGRFVGNTGTVGVSTGGELSDLMTPVAASFAAAGQIYIAQLAGAKDQKNLRSAIGTLITLLLLLSCLFMSAALIFHGGILSALNCPEEAFAEASSYMMITALGMPFIFAYNGICSILRGLGESKRPLFFVIVAAVCNLFLDLLLVVVFKMGAAGTAIATVASQIGAAGAAFWYLYKNRSLFSFRFDRSFFRIEGHALKVILTLGIPQLVRVFSVQFSMLWVKAHINAFGLISSATYSVGNKIEKFMNIFIQGIDGASGAIIGQNLGARKHDRVIKVVRTTLTAALGVSLCVAAVFLFASKPLYSIFTSDPEVIAYGAVFLRIMALASLVSAFSISFKAVATGSGAAALCLLIGVLDGVCRIGICLIASALCAPSSSNYFWGAALCQLVPGILCLIYFLRGGWRTRKLLSEQ